MEPSLLHVARAHHTHTTVTFPLPDKGSCSVLLLPHPPFPHSHSPTAPGPEAPASGKGRGAVLPCRVVLCVYIRKVVPIRPTIRATHSSIHCRGSRGRTVCSVRRVLLCYPSMCTTQSYLFHLHLHEGIPEETLPTYLLGKLSTAQV